MSTPASHFQPVLVPPPSLTSKKKSAMIFRRGIFPGALARSVLRSWSSKAWWQLMLSSNLRRTISISKHWHPADIHKSVGIIFCTCIYCWQCWPMSSSAWFQPCLSFSTGASNTGHSRQPVVRLNHPTTAHYNVFEEIINSNSIGTNWLTWNSTFIQPNSQN